MMYYTNFSLIYFVYISCCDVDYINILIKECLYATNSVIIDKMCSFSQLIKVYLNAIFPMIDVYILYRRCYSNL